MQSVLTFIGGILTSLFTYYGLTRTNRSKNNVDREDVYADHMPELWERMDKITAERDELKAQVEVLQLTVTEQSNKIDAQSKIISELTLSVDNLKNALKSKGDI